MNINHEYFSSVPLSLDRNSFFRHPSAVYFGIWGGGSVAVGRLLDKLLRRLFYQSVLMVEDQLPIHGVCLYHARTCDRLLDQKAKQNKFHLYNSNRLGIMWRIYRALYSYNKFRYYAWKRWYSVTKNFLYSLQLVLGNIFHEYYTPYTSILAGNSVLLNGRILARKRNKFSFHGAFQRVFFFMEIVQRRVDGLFYLGNLTKPQCNYFIRTLPFLVAQTFRLALYHTRPVRAYNRIRRFSRHMVIVQQKFVRLPSIPPANPLLVPPLSDYLSLRSHEHAISYINHVPHISFESFGIYTFFKCSSGRDLLYGRMLEKHGDSLFLLSDLYGHRSRHAVAFLHSLAHETKQKILSFSPDYRPLSLRISGGRHFLHVCLAAIKKHYNYLATHLISVFYLYAKRQITVVQHHIRPFIPSSQLCLSDSASSSHAFRAGGLRLRPASSREALCA